MEEGLDEDFSNDEVLESYMRKPERILIRFLSIPHVGDHDHDDLTEQTSETTKPKDDQQSPINNNLSL